MSSFAALNGAFTSLTAQRIALEVTGQNISNVNTPGYTRQRVNLEAIASGVKPTLHSSQGVRASGVQVVSVDRLGDVFLETKARTQASTAARLTATAESWQLLETTVQEPGDHGLASSLDTFFAAWQDVANRPDDGAAGSVLLGNAAALVNDITEGSRNVEDQWAASRSQASALAREINTTAAAVADLNGRIRDALVSGADANVLIDQRGVLLQDLAANIGGEVRQRADGTVDVMVGGNALVRGDNINEIAVHGSATLAGMTSADADPGPGDGVARMVWADSGHPTGATGGRLTGLIEALAPTGPMATMAETYQNLATRLATEVNGLYNPSGDGVDFFSIDTDDPSNAVRSLAVSVTDADDLITGRPDEIDGSIAAQIAELSGARDLWAAAVVDLGVETRTAVRRAEAATVTQANAEAQLLSQTAVDLDEEGMNLVMYQRAYEAAARVLTTVDEMLDTLINRTGRVGRR